MSQRLQRQGRNYLEEYQHARTRSDDRVYPSRVTVHRNGHSSFTRYVKRPWNDPDELGNSSSEDESYGAEIYSLVDELSTDDDDEVDFARNGIFEQEAEAPLSSNPLIRAASGHNGWCMKPTVTTKPRDQTGSPALDSVSAGYGDYLFIL